MTNALKITLKPTRKSTLPDYRDVGGMRGISARRDDSCGVRTAVVPLAGLALSIGLATVLLEPCLAAAGLPGIGALLAASMAALFAVLLAIVSLSVAAAIAAMLLRRVAGAALYAAFSPPLRRPRVAPPAAATLASSSRDPP